MKQVRAEADQVHPDERQFRRFFHELWKARADLLPWLLGIVIYILGFIVLPIYMGWLPLNDW